jgi:hypothetical protein
MHKVPVFGRLAHTFRHEHTRSRTPPETVMDGTGKEALLWLDAGFWFCWRDCCDRDRHCHGVDTLAFRRAGKCQATSARTATETAGRQSDALPLKRSFLSVQTCKLSSRKAQWSRVMWPNWTVCLRVSTSWTASENSQQVQMWGSTKLCFLQVSGRSSTMLMLVFW